MINMFCTNKEQDTCRVEKMTCEGCFFSKDSNLTELLLERERE